MLLRDLREKVSGLIDKQKIYIIPSGGPAEETNALSFSVFIHAGPEEKNILKDRQRALGFFAE